MLSGLKGRSYLYVAALLAFMALALAGSALAPRDARAQSAFAVNQPLGTVTDTPTSTPQPTPPPCGLAWRAVSSPDPGSGDNVFNGVSASGPDNVWVVGFYFDGDVSKTITMHWDGSAWRTVPSPNVGDNSNFLSRVLALSASDVWAVGYYFSGNASLSLIIHWDGNQWN